MDKKIDRFFNKFSDSYDNSAFEQSLGARWLSNLEIDFILGSCEIKEGDKVLDIGVGTGRNADLLLKKGAIVEGMDISEGMMEKARRKLNGEKINFVIADAGKDIPFHSDIFDYVICVRVLKYIPNWRYTIKEISRVLKKDGIFILEIANLYSVQYFGLDKANYFLFNMKEMKDVLENEGLIVTKVRGGSRIAFPIYARINNHMVLKLVTWSESFIDKILPKNFLSRNIMITCKKDF